MIEDYVLTQKKDISVYNYTNGAHVLIDNVEQKAYTRNGYFFSVIIKDDEYVTKVANIEKDNILEYLDNRLAEKYEDSNDVDDECEDEEDE